MTGALYQRSLHASSLFFVPPCSLRLACDTRKYVYLRIVSSRPSQYLCLTFHLLIETLAVNVGHPPRMIPSWMHCHPPICSNIREHARLRIQPYIRTCGVLSRSTSYFPATLSLWKSTDSVSCSAKLEPSYLDPLRSSSSIAWYIPNPTWTCTSSFNSLVR